jgi:hypothetical protein
MPEWLKPYIYAAAVIAASGLAMLLARLFGWL